MDVCDDESDVVVVDAGAREVRAGWAGDDGPAECLPGGTDMREALEALEALPAEVAVVLSERPGASATEREAAAAALFRLGVGRLYISAAPLLALHHVGMETGVLVDVGEHTTTILPLLHGFPLLDAATTVPPLRSLCW